MGALGPPAFSAARSGALGSDKSQPSAHASAFAAIAARRTFTGQNFSPRTEAGLRRVRKIFGAQRHLRKNRSRQRDQKSHRLFFRRIWFSRINSKLFRWSRHPRERSLQIGERSRSKLDRKSTRLNSSH